MGDSTLNRHISSTPEGERKRVKANLREIAAYLDDHYQQDMNRHHAADILSLNFIKAHSEDFDDKGSDRYVYVGDGADSHVELDSGQVIAVESQESEETDDSDNGDDTDDKLTFTLDSGPSGGDT